MIFPKDNFSCVCIMSASRRCKYCGKCKVKVALARRGILAIHEQWQWCLCWVSQSVSLETVAYMQRWRRESVYLLLRIGMSPLLMYIKQTVMHIDTLIIIYNHTGHNCPSHSVTLAPCMCPLIITPQYNWVHWCLSAVQLRNGSIFAVLQYDTIVMVLY